MGRRDVEQSGDRGEGKHRGETKMRRDREEERQRGQ